MPITPLHLAAAAPAKALLKKRFSVGLFFAVNAAIDVEPVIRALRGYDNLHGLMHTWHGSLLIAWLAVCMWAIAMTYWPQHFPRLSWSVMLTTAWYAAWTHVAMDGMMHADVPVWGRASWATEAVLDELMLFAVLLGAAVAAVTYGLPWALSAGRRGLESLYARLKG